MIVLVMGVSGSGKSWLGERLAAATGWPFAEADEFHSEANRAKMAAGIPLTDEDRTPWLAALRNQLLAWNAAGQNGVMTCSALKAAYRTYLSEGVTGLHFVWLDPPRAVLEARMTQRPGHFMPPALLDSQLNTLEPPTDVLRFDGSESTEVMIATILNI